MTPRRLHACLWLPPLLLLIPALLLDASAMFGNTDALFYTLLMKLSGEQLLMGDLWPHWLINADAGMGAPLMYTFPPLAYLLTAVLTLPLSLLQAGEGSRMLAGMYVATVASGYTSFAWLRGHFPPKAALAGALLYMLLPYRLVYMYLHFNLAQLWALAWLPLWMLSCDRILAGKRLGILGFAISAALVCYTHPLTLLAFGFVPVAYTLWKGFRQFDMPYRLFAALMMAAALVASYCATFLQAKSWFVSEGPDGGFTSGKFNLFVNLSHIDSSLLSVYLAIGLMTYLLSRRVPEVPRACRFWAVLLLALWLMTLSVSAPLWRLLPPLQYLQFPAARLHAGMLVAVVFLATAMIAHRGALKEAPLFLRPAVLWVLIAAATALTLTRLPAVYAEAQGLTPEYVQTMQELSIFPLPYRTRWSSIGGQTLYNQRERIRAMPQAHFMIGGGTVTVTEWAPGRIAFSAEVRGGTSVVELRQRYVPVWSGFDNRSPVPVTVLPVESEGLIAVTLQHGRHEVKLKLTKDKTVQIADWLTLATLALGAAYAAWWRFRRA